MADRDTVDADQLYKGKRFKVAGVVEAINSSIDDAHGSYTAGFQDGMRISLIFTGHGDLTRTPMPKDCAPAN
ncbi:hypothetical protein ACIOAU_20415 [Pseudomonas sp. NPDC088322]|uniref:hypothetical protein n=1 Tax=Pseudomonas sp. NPDC088322 TaxID=3364452 RepID=UPI0037F12AD6